MLNSLEESLEGEERVALKALLKFEVCFRKCQSIILRLWILHPRVVEHLEMGFEV